MREYVHRVRTSGGPSHDLLVLLDRHRVMTTGQLARATLSPERTARYRIELFATRRHDTEASALLQRLRDEQRERRWLAQWLRTGHGDES